MLLLVFLFLQLQNVQFKDFEENIIHCYINFTSLAAEYLLRSNWFLERLKDVRTQSLVFGVGFGINLDLKEKNLSEKREQVSHCQQQVISYLQEDIMKFTRSLFLSMWTIVIVLYVDLVSTVKLEKFSLLSFN